MPAHFLSEIVASFGLILVIFALARSGRSRAAPAAVGASWSPPPTALKVLGYDKLIVGTRAVPVRPPISGLTGPGARDGVHLLHSMGDTFAVMRTLEQTAPARPSCDSLAGSSAVSCRSRRRSLCRT